jgi:hypothetical protein
LLSLSLHYKETKNYSKRGRTICCVLPIPGDTSPKNSVLLGGNGNTLKLKTTAKLKVKEHRLP